MESLNDRFENDVFSPYLELVKAHFRIHKGFGHIKALWDSKLTPKELLKGPYLEKSQLYAQGGPLDSLTLDQRTKTAIRKKLKDRELHDHQTRAIKQVLDGGNVVVATGTSSGKTLCYQIPILDNLVKDSAPGLRAIIIYPLNALVNDQLDEWESLLGDFPNVTFARFTGQTPKTQEDYEDRLRTVIDEEISAKELSQHEKQYEIARRLKSRLEKDRSAPNRLNHREAIRINPPNILVTNFSMLEYLLERPVDAPIFENAQLKFLVLDEAHAYRGVQSTEIAFLISRVKDRLNVKNLSCIATSATLGKQSDPESIKRVARFAVDLFGEAFDENKSVIYGTPDKPALKSPQIQISIDQYIKGAELLRQSDLAGAMKILSPKSQYSTLANLLEHDGNFYKLRSDILKAPKLLSEAASELWPKEPQAEVGVQALLETVATAKKISPEFEDLLPTRLHYFVKSQDGLFTCLHKGCPGRKNNEPAIFVSSQERPEVPVGFCPDCWNNKAGRENSKLVELVSCRKCGYLYGALQDLGPKREQSSDSSSDESKSFIDSFTTELGWSADSFWTYFSVESEFPFPDTEKLIEDDSDEEVFSSKEIDRIDWCVKCGKKRSKGAGDVCLCERPHVRSHPETRLSTIRAQAI